MSDTKPLLIELGCEELPVKALPGLAGAFAENILKGFESRDVTVGVGALRVLYTPRRLAVLVESVSTVQPSRRTEALGPYVNIALDGSGNPTRALLGFAQKFAVDWSDLERGADAKGERFVYRQEQPGAAVAELLPEILAEAIKALPIAKPMRWGDHDYGFARPVHWLVLLFGNDVVDCGLLGVRSGRSTRGHRFHHPAAIEDRKSVV